MQTPKTLGQIAYEVHCEVSGRPMAWDDLSSRAQVAWNETAVVIQYAHHFMTTVDEPGEASTKRIITEMVDGGGIGARGGTASNIEKDGTG